MKKAIFGSFLLMSLVLTPAVARAATIEELQAKIIALTAQLKQLKAQQSQNVLSVRSGGEGSGGSGTVSAQPGDEAPVGQGSSCVDVQTNMGYRSTDAKTGDGVSILQDFLQASGYLNGEPTGFFGQLTLRAVKGYQKANGLSPTGYVGPLTRAKIKSATCGITNPTEPAQPVQACPLTYAIISCKAGSHPGGWCNQECVPDDSANIMFTASPAYGSAPLSVKLTTSGLNPNGVYEIYFGDGTASGLSEAGGGFNVLHNYASEGTYTAKLLDNVSGNGKVIAEATITVTDSNTSRSAPVVNGVEGPASVIAGQIAKWAVSAYVPNQPGAQLSYSVVWGDEGGLVPMALSSGPASASLQTSATFSHVYKYNGTYKPKFTVSNSAGSASAEMTVSVGANASSGITVTAPNGGENWNIGGTYTIRYYLRGINVDANNPILIYLQKGYDYPSTKSGVNSGLLIATTKDTESYSYTVPADIANWPGLGSNFTIKVCASNCTVSDTSDSTFSISKSEPPSITVTAPNGGEQWEIGQLNTITWSPYGYNPDVNPPYDVVGWLDKKIANGGIKTVGKIIPGGMASIHWEGRILTDLNHPELQTFPEPGEYYIRVENTKTGASDSSNASFTLLPRAVDMQVNGSDGPITLSDNQKITVTLTTNKVTSCTLTGVRGYSGGPIYNDSRVPMGGSPNSYSLYASTNGAITARCTRSSDGSNVYDTVYVNPVVSAVSLQITSPNGGEQVQIGQPYYILIRQSGLKTLSVALYKNDQWVQWIAKDILPEKFYQGGYSWTPQFTNNDANDDLDDVLRAGNVFKIYITGQKADGSGYVDDKSDAPFGFISSTQTVAPTLTLTASPSTIAEGQSITVTWSSGNATACTASGSWEGSIGMAGTRRIDNVLRNSPNLFTYTATCTGPGGSVTQSVTVTVQPAPSTASVDMKVNGSDGPLNLADNQLMTVSLTTSNIKSCTISGVRPASATPVQSTQVPMMGDYNQYSFYSYVFGSSASSISVQCIGADGSAQSDSVVIKTYSGVSSVNTSDRLQNMANVLMSLKSILKGL